MTGLNSEELRLLPKVRYIRDNASAWTQSDTECTAHSPLLHCRGAFDGWSWESMEIEL